MVFLTMRLVHFDDRWESEGREGQGYRRTSPNESHAKSETACWTSHAIPTSCCVDASFACTCWWILSQLLSFPVNLSCRATFEASSAEKRESFVAELSCVVTKVVCLNVTRRYRYTVPSHCDKLNDAVLSKEVEAERQQCCVRL